MKGNIREEANYCFYCVRHPMNGFDGVKWENRGSFRISILIMLCFFLVQILQTQLTGFIFNTNNPDEFSIFPIMATTIGGVLMCFVANSAVSSLMPSEAKYKHIFFVICYSLVPYIVFTAIQIPLSNLVSQEVGVFLNFLSIIGIGWTGIILICGMYQVHQFSFPQTIANLFLTVVGIVVILFLILLLYSLFQQVYTFFYTIFSEIMFRI